MLFCAAQAPELFGRDQRYGVAAAVLLAGPDPGRLRARPDRRPVPRDLRDLDVVPQLVLSIGAILAAADPLTGLREDLPDVPRYLAVCPPRLGPAGRRRDGHRGLDPATGLATAAIIAVFIVPPIVVG